MAPYLVEGTEGRCRFGNGPFEPWHYVVARSSEIIALLLREGRRFVTKDAIEPPACPKCGKVMRLARVIPSIFEQESGPTTRTFECQSCGTTITVQSRPEP